MRTFLGSLLLLVTLLSTAGWGQQDAKAKPGGERKRFVYVVRHAPALSLAEVLSDHFKDDADVEVRAVPDQVTNTLLINVSATAFDEVVQILGQLDRAPQTVTLEVLVVELAGTPTDKAAAGAPERRPAPKRGDVVSGLTGPAADVLAKARRMESGSELDILHRVRLTTLDNQKTMAQIGERKPIVQGLTRSQFGTIKNTTTINLGMIVAATPRVGPDGSVLVQLDFEKSQLAPCPDDVVIAALAGEEPVRSPSILTSICKSTVQIPRDQAVVLGDIQTNGKEASQLLLIVTATIGRKD